MAMATATGSSSRSAGSRLTVVLAWTLLCFVIAGVEALDAPTGAPVGTPSLAPTPVAPGGTQPEDFSYYQIWADQEGETHFTKCKMQGFNLTIYSSLPQYVRSDFGGTPKLMVLTELAVGLAQPLHPAPQVQFVVTLSGSWYIETTDGTRHEFVKGDLLFQDDISTSPADKTPEHYSGTVGNEPCQQLVVQLTRPPQVDSVCPF